MEIKTTFHKLFVTNHKHSSIQITENNKRIEMELWKCEYYL